MSTTVPVNVSGDPESTTHERPSFINPVPAHVTSGGKAVGELDAYLQWDGESLIARVALPVLPGHVVRASCHLEHARNAIGLDARPTIRSLDVTIEHVGTIRKR